MRKFLMVLLIVVLAMGILAACAPIEEINNIDLSEVGDYARALPTWVIIVGAIVLFFIGFGIIWKLIPGFIKVIALIALAVIIAGVAYGVWRIPLVNDTIDTVDNYINSSQPADTD